MQLYSLIFLLFLNWLRLVSSHEEEEEDASGSGSGSGSKQLASDETEYDKSTAKSREQDIAVNIQELDKILQNQKESRQKKNKVKVGSGGEH